METLQKFFDPATTGAERRKIYTSMIRSATQYQNSIDVIFHISKAFSVEVHIAQGRNYQRAFGVDVSKMSIDQGTVVIDVSP